MSTYRKVHLLTDVEQDGCCKDRLHDLGPQSIVEARKPCKCAAGIRSQTASDTSCSWGAKLVRIRRGSECSSQRSTRRSSQRLQRDPRTVVLVDAQEGVQGAGVLVLRRVRLGLRHEPRLDEQQRVRHHRRPQLGQRPDEEDLHKTSAAQISPQTSDGGLSSMGMLAPGHSSRQCLCGAASRPIVLRGVADVRRTPPFPDIQPCLPLRQVAVQPQHPQMLLRPHLEAGGRDGGALAAGLGARLPDARQQPLEQHVLHRRVAHHHQRRQHALPEALQQKQKLLTLAGSTLCRCKARKVAAPAPSRQRAFAWCSQIS
jgi:hypothetical protein